MPTMKINLCCCLRTPSLNFRVIKRSFRRTCNFCMISPYNFFSNYGNTHATTDSEIINIAQSPTKARCIIYHASKQVSPYLSILTQIAFHTSVNADLRVL